AEAAVTCEREFAVRGGDANGRGYDPIRPFVGHLGLGVNCWLRGQHWRCGNVVTLFPVRESSEHEACHREDPAVNGARNEPEPPWGRNRNAFARLHVGGYVGVECLLGDLDTVDT